MKHSIMVAITSQENTYTKFRNLLELDGLDHNIKVKLSLVIAEDCVKGMAPLTASDLDNVNNYLLGVKDWFDTGVVPYSPAFTGSPVAKLYSITRNLDAIIRQKDSLYSLPYYLINLIKNSPNFIGAQLLREDEHIITTYYSVLLDLISEHYKMDLTIPRLLY